jgi:hypothetical protein
LDCDDQLARACLIALISRVQLRRTDDRVYRADLVDIFDQPTPHAQRAPAPTVDHLSPITLNGMKLS